MIVEKTCSIFPHGTIISYFSSLCCAGFFLFLGGGGGGVGVRKLTTLQNINGLILTYNYTREICNMCITENTADGVASCNGLLWPFK